MDYAEIKYDRQTIDDVKVLFRVLLLYVPLPLFWALFDQQASRWTLQATRMDGDMGSWDIKPDQIQMINPFLILAFIPLYEALFYPLLAKIGISRPLQKLTLGGVFAGIAFILSGVVELELEKTYPIIPRDNSTQLRIFNGIPDCEYHIKMPELLDEDIILKGISNFEQKFIASKGKTYYAIISSTNPDCPARQEVWALDEFPAFSVYLKRENSQTLVADKYEDDVKKPTKGSPMVRVLCNEPAKEVVFKRGSVEKFNENSDNKTLIDVPFGTYDILYDGQMVESDIYLGQGGVYTYIMQKDNTNSWNTKLVEVTQANTVNMLWLIPQYVVMTLAEVMFSVTGLEFSYAQAPESMKSVIQACFQLTVAFGNVIVVIIAEAKIFESQADEFFLFAGLMFVDMIIFAFLAYFYKPNDPNKGVDDEANSTVTENTQDSYGKPSAIEFNAAKLEASPSAPTEIPEESNPSSGTEAHIRPHTEITETNHSIEPEAQLSIPAEITKESNPSVEVSKDTTAQPEELDKSSSNVEPTVDHKKVD